MFSLDIQQQAHRLIKTFSAQNLLVATAESCTGGLIAASLTEIAGSSAVVDCGFVTYSNEAKTALLDVPAALIESHGAVSEEVARSMANGALLKSRADYVVAVTGIAGPGGGTEDKPVGLVYIAVRQREKETVVSKNLFGEIDRDAVRENTVIRALQMLIDQATP